MEEVGSHRRSRSLLSLKSIATKCIVITVLPRGFGKANFGPLDRLRDDIHSLPVGHRLQQQLWDTTMRAMEEVIAWWHRHSALFLSRMATRCGHLLLYVGNLRWHSSFVEVDDLSSAEELFALNENWPQLRFQLACAYAMHQRMATFDYIWLRVFRRRLSGHPLYDFWLTYLDQGDHLFDQRGIVPKQPVAAVFSWASCNGFLELIRFLWSKMPPAQSEYLTVLTWNRLCRKADNGPLFAFLCDEMCKINDVNVCRITSQCFLHASWRLCDEETKGDAERQVTFLLQYGCPKLRQALFPTDHYRVLLMAVRSRNSRVLESIQSSVAHCQLLDGLNAIKNSMEEGQWRLLKAVLLNEPYDRSGEHVISIKS
ncbi:hypothetical protein D918_08130 [Trichuris suis]|nr:hypothetical protein D918_08130 [Trichuris suis]